MGLGGCGGILLGQMREASLKKPRPQEGAEDGWVSTEGASGSGSSRHQQSPDPVGGVLEELREGNVTGDNLETRRHLKHVDP